MVKKILVTGGAGFIGSAFVRELIQKNYLPLVVDKLTYAGDLRRIEKVKGKYKFYKSSIFDRKAIENIINNERVKCMVNFSAETHVDRSIQDSSPFIRTNILGTQILLDLAKKYKFEKFIQISTDEVYGEISKGSFSGHSPLSPSSPYAASKASADLLIKAYMKTFGFPAIIVRPCNNYGPWQYPEKFIPLSIFKVLRDEKIPVYGNGRNIREWLYVEDCAEGILQILEQGEIGAIYNLGSGEEKENIVVAEMILKALGKDDKMIQFVNDRPGHDLRYSLNSEKIHKQGIWKAKTPFIKGLEMTIKWCIENKAWMLKKWNEVTNLYKRKVWDEN